MENTRHLKLDRQGEIENNLLVTYSHSLRGKDTTQNTGPQWGYSQGQNENQGLREAGFSGIKREGFSLVPTEGCAWSV